MRASCADVSRRTEPPIDVRPNTSPQNSLGKRGLETGASSLTFERLRGHKLSSFKHAEAERVRRLLTGEAENVHATDKSESQQIGLSRSHQAKPVLQNVLSPHLKGLLTFSEDPFREDEASATMGAPQTHSKWRWAWSKCAPMRPKSSKLEPDAGPKFN